MSDRIMYICTQCATHSPEGCGHFNRAELRVVGDEWLCEGCFDELKPEDREHMGWSDFAAPPEYAPCAVTSGIR